IAPAATGVSARPPPVALTGQAQSSQLCTIKAAASGKSNADSTRGRSANPSDDIFHASLDSGTDDLIWQTPYKQACLVG
ncbi:MAG: hypothetical protein ABR922_17175, partial [Streptosporangiaceae bacterium]